MYSDGVSGRKRSVMDRLGSGGGGGSSSGSRLPRPDGAKRFRLADGTWRRELYKDSGGLQSSSGLASRNPQAKQKIHPHQSNEVVRKSSVPDLREKLSGVQRPQLSSTVQIPNPVLEVAKTVKSVEKREPPANSSVPVIKKVDALTAPKQSQSQRELPGSSAIPVTKKVNAPPAPKQSQSEEKVDASLYSLLESLELQKYLVNFQAEEVDMKALVHMNEEDMKALGIPMMFLNRIRELSYRSNLGPRKKILSAMSSRKRKSSKSLPTS